MNAPRLFALVVILAALSACGAAVFAIATVGGNAGLYRFPVTGAAAEKLVDVADLGGDRNQITALFKSGGSWLVVTNNAVYRVR